MGARVCMQKGEWFGVAGAQNCVAGVVRQSGRGRQGRGQGNFGVRRGVLNFIL